MKSSIHRYVRHEGDTAYRITLAQCSEEYCSTSVEKGFDFVFNNSSYTEQHNRIFSPSSKSAYNISSAEHIYNSFLTLKE